MTKKKTTTKTTKTAASKGKLTEDKPTRRIDPDIGNKLLSLDTGYMDFLNNSLNGLKRLNESYNQRYVHEDMIYYNSVYGSHTEHKCLPYKDWRSYIRMLETGCRAYWNYPVLRNAIDTMVGYIIGNKVKYLVTVANGYDDEVTADKLKQVKKHVFSLARRPWWHTMQSESVVRYFRDGGYIRRKFKGSDGKLTVRYIELADNSPPEDLPGEDALEQKRLAPFGVRHVEGDAVTPDVYWIESKDELGQREWEDVPAAEIQEAKFGVDRNDPRGIPLGWLTLCELIKLYQTNDAMVSLANTQSAYAAVRTYEMGTFNAHIERIAKGEAGDWEENGGVPKPGGIMDAKGFKFELLGASIPANQFVEIISQQLRLVGGSISMPEHIISMDADTGNRSSLISAESPFARHIGRRQTELGNDDIDLVWDSVQIDMGISDDELNFLKEAIVITPKFPEVVTHDQDKVVTSEIQKVASKLQSDTGAIIALGGDPDEVLKGIDEMESRQTEKNPDLQVFLSPEVRDPKPEEGSEEPVDG